MTYQITAAELLIIGKRIGVILGFVLACVVVHEIGHAWAYKKETGRWPKMQIRKGAFCVSREDVDKLNDEQYLQVLNAGVWFGVIPIVGAIPFLPFADMFILLLIYITGIMSDVNWIRKMQNKKKSEEWKKETEKVKEEWNDETTDDDS